MAGLAAWPGWCCGKEFTKKGLQSKSATASLLIKSYKCMNEEVDSIIEFT